MRRLIATLIAPVLAASALLVSAGGVAADEPQYVYLDPYFCTADNGQGTIYDPLALPPDSQILLLQGWATKTRGQLVGFLNNVTWVMTVNGEPVELVANTGFIRWGQGYWAELVLFAGPVVTGGESLDTHFDVVVKSAVFDGWSVYKAGSVYDGGIDCHYEVA